MGGEPNREDTKGAKGAEVPYGIFAPFALFAFQRALWQCVELGRVPEVSSTR